MKKGINDKELAQIKTDLGKAESAVKRIPISAISVNEETLKQGRILVNDQPVSVSAGFFSRLGSMLKINAGLTRDMIKNGDTRVAASLINGLKEYSSANKKDNDVMLIANIATKSVMDICVPGRYKRATNDTVFDVTERIMNDNPNLALESVDFNPNTGRSSINILNNEQVNFAQAGKDEFFKFGFSITQTTKDTIVESYNQRLICANGLRTSLGEGTIGNHNQLHFEDKFRLTGTGTEDIRIFLNKIEEMKKREFVSPTFEATINRATSTKASLFEVENSWNIAKNLVQDIDPEMRKQYQAAMARDYFHSYGDTLNRIHSKGKDSSELNSRQKQFIKTGMSIWDVVNSMTFLGSNNSGFDLKNKHELKYKAGELFSKGVTEGYDLEFAKYASL